MFRYLCRNIPQKNNVFFILYDITIIGNGRLKPLFMFYKPFLNHFENKLNTKKNK